MTSAIASIPNKISLGQIRIIALLICVCLSGHDLRAQSNTIEILSITTERQSEGDRGYTLDGSKMLHGARPKLLNPENFGESGTYPKSIEIEDKYGKSGSLVAISAEPTHKLFFVGAFDKLHDSMEQITDDELAALYNWSVAGGKLIITSFGKSDPDSGTPFDLNIFSGMWGYQFATHVPSVFIPTPIGESTSIFDGPFGKIQGASQAASLQGYFDVLPSNSRVLAEDFAGRPTLIMDCQTLDLIVADGDGYNYLGGVSDGDEIMNSQDTYWANTIVFMDQLQHLPIITQNHQVLSVNDQYLAYEWYHEGTPISTASQLPLTATGEYTVKVTFNGGCEWMSEPYIAHCLPQPTVDLGPDLAQCSDAPLTLTATSSGTSFQWQDGSTQATYQAHSGTYWVTTTDVCGMAIDSITIFTFPEKALPEQAKYCQGDILTLDASLRNTTYEWDDHSTSAIRDVTAPGAYWVDYTNACGVHRDTIQVKEDQPANFDFGPDTTMCNQQLLVLDVSFPNSSALWQDGSTDTVYEINEPGHYVVEVTNTCGTYHDDLDVKYIVEPRVELGEDKILCEGNRIIIETAAMEATYLWQDGKHQSYILVDQPGLYWVEVTNVCGTSRDSVHISYITPPVDLLGKDTTHCGADELILNAEMEHATYLWSDGSDLPYLSVNGEGRYSVEVTVGNCEFEDEINVSTMRCMPDLEMPNAFSPNRDGINDQLTPILQQHIKSMHTVIVDRSGHKVNETDDLWVLWDGTMMNGNEAETGIYYYFLEYEDFLSRQYSTRGTITLLR